MGEPARPRWYENPPWRHVVDIDVSIFQSLLLAYLGLLLLETLREGTVTRFLPLNLLLVAVLVTGIVAVLGHREEPEAEEHPVTRRDYILVASVAVGAWLILWYQLRSLGWIQYPVSVLGGLLVGLVSLSVLWPEREEPAGADQAEPSPAPKPAEAPTTPTSTAPSPRIPLMCPRCGLRGTANRDVLAKSIDCPRCKFSFVLEETPLQP